MNTQVVVLGFILALAYVPHNLQIVLVLVAGSIFASSILGKNSPARDQDSIGGRSREHGPTEMAKDVPSRAADRFEDSKTAIRHLKIALKHFDPYRADQIACSLDDCIEEYLDALAGEPGEIVDAYLSSHMLTREDIRGLLIEANTTCDGSAKVVSNLDKASEKISALFQSFDRVLHLGGYTSRAGPIPTMA